MLHICTQTWNKPVSNLSIMHQSMHGWMLFLILFVRNISCNKCALASNLSNIFRKIQFGNYNAYCSVYIEYIESVDDCEYVIKVCLFICRLKTAPALCTNSSFFALKIPCTEINDWQHDLQLVVKNLIVVSTMPSSYGCSLIGPGTTVTLNISTGCMQQRSWQLIQNIYEMTLV